jgi:hypothetical protein
MRQLARENTLSGLSIARALLIVKGQIPRFTHGEGLQRGWRLGAEAVQAAEQAGQRGVSVADGAGVEWL